MRMQSFEHDQTPVIGLRMLCIAADTAQQNITNIGAGQLLQFPTPLTVSNLQAAVLLWGEHAANQMA